MAYNDPQLLHLDSMLTGISVGWDNPDAFVASTLFPTVRVAKDSDKYYIYNRDVWGRVMDDIRTPGSEANELPPMTLSRDTYFIEEHALEDVVPDEELENADAPLQPAQDATARLTNTILLNRENIQMTMATTAANYASGYSTTLSGTSQFNDYVNSDPIGVSRTARKKIHDTMFRDPNVVIMGYEVYWTLLEHTKLLSRITYSAPQVTSREILSEVLGLPARFIVAEGGYVNSVYGQAETTGYLWPKDILFAWVPPTPGRRTPAFAYEFVKPYGGGNIQPTERWREEKRKSDVVRVSRRYDNKFIAVDGSGKAIAGYLVKNAVA